MINILALNDVIKNIEKLTKTIGQYFNKIIELIKFLVTIPAFIIKNINLLPGEIQVLIYSVVSISIIVFVYKLIR